MKNKLHNLTTFSVLVAILVVALATQVRSTGIATGSYYLDTPLPIADFYIGQYSNNTYFALNGTNWQNFLRSDNASYVFLMTLGNMSDGGHLIVGSGTFTLSPIIIPIPSNTTFEGQGASTILNGSTTHPTWRGIIENENYMTSTIDRNIIIRNLKIDGNMDNINPAVTRPCGISLQGVENVIIESVFIRKTMNYGIRLLGDTDNNRGTTTNVAVRNCFQESSAYNFIICEAFNLGDCEDILIDGNWINDTDTGIDTWKARRVTITNNFLTNNFEDTLFTNSIDIGIESTSEDILITNNFMSGGGPDAYNSAGIWIENTAENISMIGNYILDKDYNGISSSANNVLIEGNTVRNRVGTQDYGITSSGDNSQVVGNKIDGDFYYAIRVAGDNNLIDSNIITNGHVGYYRIQVQGNDNDITGNYISETALKSGTGVRIYTGNNTRVFGNRIKNLVNGVIVDAGIINTTVVENYFDDLTTPIQDSGTNSIIRNNRGYVTENSGLQTVASGETISHGLASAPVYASLVCLNTTYDSVPIAMSYNWTATGTSTLEVYVYWTNGTVITDDVILVAWEARTWN